jgi:uncharacterized protein
VLVFLAGIGCEKPPHKLSAAQIHAITEQLAAEGTSSGATVRIKKSATDSDRKSRDGVNMKFPPGVSVGDAKAVASLLQRLERVATRNNLTQDEPVASTDSMHLVLRRSGLVTHEIEIDSARDKPVVHGAPKLAIILDDLGSDPAAADALLAMPYPLTVSILPGQAHSTEIAEQAHRRGFEVMLHLPMQSVGKEQSEAQELRHGMGAPQVASMVNEFLMHVPDAKGVNNHQGSEATADATLMSELMSVLRDKGLFYIDSRTTAATVAFDAAQSNGVPSAFRNVPFLDDVEEVAAVRKQLELAFRGAKEKGEAIAIGHPHAATREALREMLPKAREEGIELVVASQLVH